MKLSKNEAKILRESVEQTYPNITDLGRLLSENMKITLTQIVNINETKTNIVFQLITELEARGYLEAFIKFMIKDRPNSPFLKDVKKAFPHLAQDKVTDDELYKELLKLNFYDQCRNFLNINSVQNTSLMILLSGELKNGVKVVYEKLKLLAQSSSLSPFDSWEIKIGGVLGNTEYSQLWHQLGEYLGLSSGCSIEEIKKELSNNCRQRNIAVEIIMENISCYDLQYIINDFLTPLAQISSARKFLIFLIFLLDSRDRRIRKTSRECLTKLNEQLDSHVACKLEVKKKFRESHIDNWLIEAMRTFGSVKTKGQSITSALVYDKSNKGCPLDVYKAMYEYYDVTWEGSQIHRRVC